MLDYLPADRTTEQRRTNMQAILDSRIKTSSLTGIALYRGYKLITGDYPDGYRDACHFYAQVEEDQGEDAVRELAAEVLDQLGFDVPLLDQIRS